MASSRRFDLRRWGLRLAERGGKTGKKHCHGEKAGSVVASPMGEWRSVRTVAQQQPGGNAGCSVKAKTFLGRKTNVQNAEFR
jgi:hypothetical protein